MDAGMQGCREGWRDGWMDGGMQGWRDGWMEGWMDEWRDGGMRDGGMQGGELAVRTVIRFLFCSSGGSTHSAAVVTVCCAICHRDICHKRCPRNNSNAAFDDS